MILYPLRFEPIYQYRIWGGRRLATLLREPLPNGGLVGEAWVLSDRADHPSKVADGTLKGWTLGPEWPGCVVGNRHTLANVPRARTPTALSHLSSRAERSVAEGSAVCFGRTH